MAQSKQHSQWEIGLDFCISVAVNLGSQAVFLQAFTPYRGLSFTGVFMALSLVRRYCVRRGFNKIVRSGQSQSRAMSLLEAWTDTVLALATAFGMVMVWYTQESIPRLSSLIVTIYILTMLRRFALRRLFEWLQTKQQRLA